MASHIPFDKKQILKILRKLTWDYTITAEEIYSCINYETEKAGFYMRDELWIKIFNNLHWYDINKIARLEEIKKILTRDLITQLYPKSNRLKYDILYKILQGEAVSNTKWDNKNNEFPEYG